ILAHPDRPEDFLEEYGGAFGRPRATPPSRATRRRLAIAVSALGILLVLQLALGSRDLLAARIPAMRPLLSALAASLGLGSEQPRLAGKLPIESCELAGAGPAGVYRMDAVLRNRASHPVQWPAIELTLTDAFGGVVASKVLLPRDYHVGDRLEKGFPGNAEESVSLEIAIDEVVTSGYRAILFYPVAVPEQALSASRNPAAADTRRILVSGSVAYDTIMVFDGRFEDHILPDRAHVLNVSFLTPRLKREYGGCAANIAYNLRGLGGEPVILAAVGHDAVEYVERLRSMGIDTGAILVEESHYTAQAFITTDLADNQINAFHPGAMSIAHRVRVDSALPACWGIVGPNGKQAMIEHAEGFADAG